MVHPWFYKTTSRTSLPLYRESSTHFQWRSQKCIAADVDKAVHDDFATHDACMDHALEWATALVTSSQALGPRKTWIAGDDVEMERSVRRVGVPGGEQVQWTSYRSLLRRHGAGMVAVVTAPTTYIYLLIYVLFIAANLFVISPLPSRRAGDRLPDHLVSGSPHTRLAPPPAPASHLASPDLT